MAAPTPGSAELLALADEIKRELSFAIFSTERQSLLERAENAIRLAAKPAEEGWQLIETAKHKNGTRILAWDGNKQFTCYFRGEHHLPHQDKPGWHEQHIRMHPTHWKPLGDPPSTTGEP